MTSIEQNKPRVERVDDIPVIYGVLERMGIQAIVDNAIKAHGNWQGLSPGWLITVWLVHILSTQSHIMEPVQQWVGRCLYLLERLSKQPVSELDFSAGALWARLAMCLRDLSQTSAWQAIDEGGVNHAAPLDGCAASGQPAAACLAQFADKGQRYGGYGASPPARSQCLATPPGWVVLADRAAVARRRGKRVGRLPGSSPVHPPPTAADDTAHTPESGQPGVASGPYHALG